MYTTEMGQAASQLGVYVLRKKERNATCSLSRDVQGDGTRPY